MTSIDMETLLTIIYVLVDDWYQAKGHKLLKGKPGAKPVFSDSEVITLMLAMDCIPFPGETQSLGFMRANYLALFPKLLDQSQFNRRARGLRLLVEQLRREWVVQLGVLEETQFLLDTKPVPVVGYKRSKHRSNFESVDQRCLRVARARPVPFFAHYALATPICNCGECLKGRANELKQVRWVVGSQLVKLPMIPTVDEEANGSTQSIDATREAA